MRIVTIMLSKNLGSMEYAALDYTRALTMAGHELHMIMHPKAAIIPAASAIGIQIHTLPHWGEWDLIAPKRLGKIIRSIRADMVVVHGNCAMNVAKKAIQGEVPIVAVMHDHHHESIHSMDAIITPTQHMAETILQLPNAPKHVYVIPNMIHMEKRTGVRRTWANPPLIGSFGKFSHENGFDIYLQALALLRQEGYEFRAVLGGDGTEDKALRKRAHELKLGDILSFNGWIEKPLEFMHKLDIFCLSSRQEPVGRKLLDAMTIKLPIVTTNCEGPSEIITHDVNGVVVHKGDATSLMQGLAYMLDDENRARAFSSEAYHTVKHRYEMERVSANLSAVLETICAAYSPAIRLKEAC